MPASSANVSHLAIVVGTVLGILLGLHPGASGHSACSEQYLGDEQWLYKGDIHGNTCTGRLGGDHMYGKGRGDRLKGQRGNDRLRGATGSDRLFDDTYGNDTDRFCDGDGRNDYIDAHDGDTRDRIWVLANKHGDNLTWIARDKMGPSVDPVWRYKRNRCPI